MRPYARGFWEFQACVAGAFGPTLQTISGRRLWVFPPGEAHAWVARPGTRSRVAVAHFDAVPEPLRQAGRVSTALSKREADHVERLLTGVEADYRRPTNKSVLRFDQVLIELTALALRDVAEEPLASGPRAVDRALAWYAEHLAQAPGVEDLAGAAAVSASHLHRLFKAARGAGPQAVMRQVQMERACALMRATGLPLAQVAEACGFSSASAFSRAFKQARGVSPQAWRSASAEVMKRSSPAAQRRSTAPPAGP